MIPSDPKEIPVRQCGRRPSWAIRSIDVLGKPWMAVALMAVENAGCIWRSVAGRCGRKEGKREDKGGGWRQQEWERRMDRPWFPGSRCESTCGLVRRQSHWQYLRSTHNPVALAGALLVPRWCPASALLRIVHPQCGSTVPSGLPSPVQPDVSSTGDLEPPPTSSIFGATNRPLTDRFPKEDYKPTSRLRDAEMPVLSRRDGVPKYGLPTTLQMYGKVAVASQKVTTPRPVSIPAQGEREND
ncbi:hypothetical protein B0J11DRAFT_505679 [Dendryphion nanum]|uniref:Uncharacterized protein n=1 Tax=Dendryphion nanum TaxID=256645 RepID=A0A9P9DVH8_9PLEO|nr:hypothetical protein B0J11DRAFT_505679 [Dendryphion nanum]